MNPVCDHLQETAVCVAVPPPAAPAGFSALMTRSTRCMMGNTRWLTLPAFLTPPPLSLVVYVSRPPSLVIPLTAAAH